MTRALLPAHLLILFSSFTLTVVSFLVLPDAASAQAVGLAGRWQQVASNAGDCPTCQIDIAPRGMSPNVFTVTASNGWSAQVKAFLQGGALAANGMGRWNDDAGGSYAGAIFSLTLTMRGADLALRMGVAHQGPIEGRFVRAGAGAAGAANFPAGSWGGIVRAGPGMDFAKVTSLAEGDPVTVLEHTGVMMNGYPWFKIKFRGNKTGYHWGGIMCAVGAPRDGLFEVCPTKAGGPAADVVGPINFSCDEGIPLVVTFDNRGATSIATVTHDSNLTLRMKQVVSGSGARYEEGRYSLHTKADTAVFSWGDGQHVCKTN
jgi:membrane-bound inhibitor of C-type lysozyme